MSRKRHPRIAPRTYRAKPRIVDWIRTIGTAIVGAVATIVAGVTIIVIAAVKFDAAVIERILRSWARLILAVAGVQVEMHSVDRLDPKQAYIVIANHRSIFDIMCLFAVLPIPIRFLAKRELFEIPVFGAILRSLRMVSIDRSAADHPTINAASASALDSGLSLVVFAEGTRVPAADSRPFKKGGFVIAQQHNVPILPITLAGTGSILPPHGRIVRSANVAVIAAEPISSAITATKSINELVLETRTVVLRNERQWLPEQRK
ncbi:MAG: 1-acyl-sn-glycerol-3-phosphate acyltransferase [Acidimicrobiia bacterium]|nr:1-acyl-sn-glycerol-3-phosphate acyltransferase [Acidimicrobiia bacterium]